MAVNKNNTVDVNQMQKLEACWSAITNLIKRKIPSQDVEDVEQETLLSAYTALNNGHKPISMKAWLWTIAKCTIYDYHHRAARPVNQTASIDDAREDALMSLHHENSGSSFEALDAATCRQSLKKAIKASCRDEERQVILLMLQVESFVRIAETLGLSENTVKSRFNRGRIKLLKYLIANDPDMVGGKEAIAAALEKVCDVKDTHSQPTKADQEPGKPGKKRKLADGAMRKLAPYLPHLFSLLLILNRRA